MPKKSISSLPVGDVRTGTSVDNLRQTFLDNLVCSFGRLPSHASSHDHCLASSIRDYCQRVWNVNVKKLKK